MTKFFPGLRRAQKGEVNYPFVDRFTWAHIIVGLGYGLIGLEFWLAAVLAIAWEVVENPLKAYLPFIFPHASADTLQNSVGDMVAVLFGWGAVWCFFHLIA